MGWSLSSYYTCIHLPKVLDTAALNALLGEFAASILPELHSQIGNHDLWQAFDAIWDDVEEATDPKEEVNVLVNQIQQFLSEISYKDGGVSLVLGSAEDTDADCEDLVNALATFLLPYATDPYLVLRSAAFDKQGGYAHQFLLYRAGNEVLLEHMTKVIERLFANPDAMVMSLASTHGTKKQVLVPVLV